MIQNAILKLLGTAGIASGLYQQSPAFQKQQELKSINKRQDIIGKAYEASMSEEEAEEVSKAYNYEDYELSKRKYELQPTEANFKAYMAASELIDSKTSSRDRMRESKKTIRGGK